MTRQNLVFRARLAGLLYIVIIGCGVGAEGLLRGPLIVAGDAAATSANLAAAELQFRLSILADVVMALSDVGVAVLFFALLCRVEPTLALAALAFRLVQAGILGLNVVHLQRAVGLIGESALAVADRDARVMELLDAHAAGYDLGLFFFAVNCFLMAALLLAARAVPAVLSWLLSAAGLVYLLGSAARVLSPELSAIVEPAYLLPFVAELALCGWLLNRGMNLTGPEGADGGS